MKLIFVENTSGEISQVYTWERDGDINLGIMKEKEEAKRRQINIKRIWTETVKQS
jgi:hypothetical protein